MHTYLEYRKIPIISPKLIFVQKAFFMGLFSGELIFGGAYYQGLEGGVWIPNHKLIFRKFPNHVACSCYFPSHVPWENVF